MGLSGRECGWCFCLSWGCGPSPPSSGLSPCLVVLCALLGESLGVGVAVPLPLARRWVPAESDKRPRPGCLARLVGGQFWLVPVPVWRDRVAVWAFLGEDGSSSSPHCILRRDNRLGRNRSSKQKQADTHVYIYIYIGWFTLCFYIFCILNPIRLVPLVPHHLSV